MIGIGTYDELAAEPPVNVVAMAQIVNDLFAHGLSRVQDMEWLHAHDNAALLGRHEYAALQALGARLSDGGTALDGVQSGFWR